METRPGRHTPRRETPPLPPVGRTSFRLECIPMHPRCHRPRPTARRLHGQPPPERQIRPQLFPLHWPCPLLRHPPRPHRPRRTMGHRNWIFPQTKTTPAGGRRHTARRRWGQRGKHPHHPGTPRLLLRLKNTPATATRKCPGITPESPRKPPPPPPAGGYQKEPLPSSTASHSSPSAPSLNEPACHIGKYAIRPPAAATSGAPTGPPPSTPPQTPHQNHNQNPNNET